MLVIEYKVVDYTYFMDEIQEYEIRLLSEMLPWSTKQSMEETRYIMYSICAPYMKQKKKVTDWWPLYTDKEHKEPEVHLEGEQLDSARKFITKIFSEQK